MLQVCAKSEFAVATSAVGAAAGSKILRKTKTGISCSCCRFVQSQNLQ